MDKAFELAFAQPIAYFIAIAVAGGLVALLLRSALVPEGRFSALSHAVTGRNTRWLFLILIVVWAVAMGAINFLSLSYLTVGGLAFVGMLLGLLLFMGFIWSVIGE
jgi:hypothetical protein